MMNEEFLAGMQKMLKDEYPAYLKETEHESRRGFRVNSLKISDDEFFSLTGFPREKSPFADHAYYLNEAGAGSSPAHAAGLFYIQEPSAGSAVTVMKPEPGMRILDLCAAPGSKTTQTAEYMQNRGLLVANEINPKRAQILKQNVERIGAANVLVLNCSPAEIAKRFSGWFDMVLCDAPCSGEGMFRKNSEAQMYWSKEAVLSCAARQRNILESAYECLKKGGVLVYSTCTFSVEENEENMAWFCGQHPDMHIEETGVRFGRKAFDIFEGSSLARRIFPMDGGEGHFICRLRRDGDGQPRELPLLKSERIPDEASAFLKQQLAVQYPYYHCYGSKIYGGTYPFINPGKCRIVRHQVLLGEMKNRRFEPDHAMYQSSFGKMNSIIELDYEEAVGYLHGLTIKKQCRKGYYAVSYGGYPLGFAKSDGQILKNKYPKEYRLR